MKPGMRRILTDEQLEKLADSFPKLKAAGCYEDTTFEDFVAKCKFDERVTFIKKIEINDLIIKALIGIK